MTSVARGGSGPEWMPDQPFYQDGVQTVTNAMNKARAQFPTDEVVFGGVLWILSPNLSGSLGAYPWEDYRADLGTVLQTYGEDVADNPNHAGFGGRFYLVNTVIPRNYDYADPVLQQEADFLMDLEADVCSEFTFCSAIQESVYIKEASMACGGGNCGRWYSGDVHWGQSGLNRIGEATAAAAAAHGLGGGNNTPPNAFFSFSCIDLSCTFTDTSSDPDGTIASRAWTFGDGGTSTATNPSHTYGAGGTYTVTLTVTDDDGASGAVSQAVSVSSGSGSMIDLQVSGRTAGPWALADLSWSPADGGTVTVYRNGDAVATTTDSGSYSDRIGRNVSGTYTYRVCETDSGDCSNEAALTLRVGAFASASAASGVAASPNPFAGRTTLAYALEAPAEVELAVYDLLGREVAVLAEGAREAGAHRVEFDAAAAGLPSGVYVYRLRVGAAVETGRLLLTR